MEGRRATLEAVAARARVGRSTVSRVINGSERVSTASREAVLRAVRELGYVPNSAARALVRRRTDTVAFVVAVEQERVFWEEPYFSAIVRGATAGLADEGIQLLLAIAESQQDRDRLATFLKARHVDGALLSSFRGDDPLPADVEQSGTPTVLVGRPTGYIPDWSVDVDNIAGARLATQHLVERGRRRITTITGPQDIQAGMDRCAGFHDVLLESGLCPLAQAHGSFTHASGVAAMRQLLDQSPELDAVFAASDSMATGALHVLRQAGRRVPEDVAVVGFDDSPVAADTDPPLTSVRQPLEEMGREMARLMIARLNNEPVAETKLVLNPALVIRQSS
ncbi:LacI family DNA-binding transcriptional regulator (plasmid) [Streptomyces sp. BB1-1-1]|uniref:LacI family DNA-binding transcriptional regulator n=1 Tax=Streptomyces sp. BB1-1-1 TaxID=3074430 RepID=UPI00287812AE|nr:LacI family DNA-binding transcriptional regulator [Streptomyces sp. BB1-1-1]WND32840.1 LacI family DNA-binding transcriptional regulator [Streptomyces sp. BB1-1-1]WND40092.1 LacI family DNA-binding transcriptional regulator [Streptomyces sp. BB1-1-1]WND40924.1 LacI family DNA-binding transcriptional regulator [Streptomyces sp. BB1-1-1]